MIRSFADKESERLWSGRRNRELPEDIQKRAMAKLALLNRAKSLADLQAPCSNRFHSLTGDRNGQHSLSINMQWRICFVWKDGDAHRVEIADPH